MFGLLFTLLGGFLAWGFVLSTECGHCGKYFGRHYFRCPLLLNRTMERIRKVVENSIAWTAGIPVEMLSVKEGSTASEILKRRSIFPGEFLYVDTQKSFYCNTCEAYHTADTPCMPRR